MKTIWRSPELGWFIDTLQGKPAFSDGHAMFIGKRHGKERKKEPGTFDKALERFLPCQPEPLKKGRKRWLNDVLSCIEFGEKVYIQEVFYNYARKNFPKVQFFVGAKRNSEQYQAVICKQDEKVVGVIMTVVDFRAKDR